MGRTYKDAAACASASGGDRKFHNRRQRAERSTSKKASVSNRVAEYYKSFKNEKELSTTDIK